MKPNLRNLLRLIVAIMAVWLAALSYAVSPTKEITSHHYSFEEWKNPPPYIPPASVCFDIPTNGNFPQRLIPLTIFMSPLCWRSISLVKYSSLFIAVTASLLCRFIARNDGSC